MKITKFFKEDYIGYAGYDVSRKIPNLVDGFKISQRKVYHTLSFHKFNSANKEIKIEQLSAKVAEFTQYLHGAGSLSGVATNMACNYDCSGNNLPLLYPDGNFGSRFEHIASAPRYIYTYLEKISSSIFKEEDYPILPSQQFEGFPIEPKYYLPVLPMVLFNFTGGIAVGFASSVYPRNPKEVIKWLKARIRGLNEDVNLDPYFKGFKGTIKSKDGKHIFIGRFNRIYVHKLEITELPPLYSLSQYIKILDTLVEKGVIKDYTDLSDKDQFRFEIKCTADFSKQKDEKILNDLKLITTDSDNLTLLDENGKVQQFANVMELLEHWYKFRLSQYSLRKVHQLEEMNKDLKILTSKQSFIKDILAGKIDIKAPLDLTTRYLEVHGFPLIDDSYNYLLNMGIVSMSKEKVEELGKSINNLSNKIELLTNTTEENIWLEEILKLEEVINKF